jgi:hemerythrin-like domain-containing protein
MYSSEEYRVIDGVLDTLEAGANQLEQGQPVRPEFFLTTTDFIRGSADGCHHKKEEGVLFKYMEKQGMPVEGLLIGVTLAEHEMGRQYTRPPHSAAQDLQAGDPTARPRTIQNSRGYVALLRQHIKQRR